jgi:hypothetical protein
LYNYQCIHSFNYASFNVVDVSPRGREASVEELEVAVSEAWDTSLSK